MAPTAPPRSANGGTIRPATTPPRGTPVCLMEKTRAYRRGSVVLASMELLAGVIGPYPRPMSMEPSATIERAGSVIISNPVVASPRETWLARIGPQRRTANAPICVANVAPKYTIATNTPTAAGPSCSRSSISGAAAVGPMIEADAAACTKVVRGRVNRRTTALGRCFRAEFAICGQTA